MQEKFEGQFKHYLLKVDFEDSYKKLAKNEEFYALKNEVGKLARADEVRTNMAKIKTQVEDLQLKMNDQVCMKSDMKNS